jgi:hypothetical protein
LGQLLCQLTLVIAIHYHMNLASSDGTLWDLQRNWERVFPFVPKLHGTPQNSNRSHPFQGRSELEPAVVEVAEITTGMRRLLIDVSS